MAANDWATARWHESTPQSSLQNSKSKPHPLFCVDLLECRPSTPVPVLMAHGNVLRSLRLQLRFDQEHGAAEEGARGPRESARKGAPREHRPPPFIPHEAVVVEPLVQTEPDAVPHRVHREGGS